MEGIIQVPEKAGKHQASHTSMIFYNRIPSLLRDYAAPKSKTETSIAAPATNVAETGCTALVAAFAPMDPLSTQSLHAACIITTIQFITVHNP